MVTDKNCQIHFIHPAVTQRQPSLGIRDRKREKGKSPDILQTFRVQETWLQNPKTRSRFTFVSSSPLPSDVDKATAAVA